MPNLQIPRCEWCGKPLKRAGTRGPAPRYCTDNKAACRVAAFRARRAAAVMHAELVDDGIIADPAFAISVPVPPATPVDEQVARAYLEATCLAGTFARLSTEARPALAWRCSQVAEALESALANTLGKD